MKKIFILFLFLTTNLYSGWLAKHVKYPDEYLINLIWVNEKLDESQQYIFPAENENALKEKFLSTIIKWAERNRESRIIVWFDSLFIPPIRPKYNSPQGPHFNEIEQKEMKRIMQNN